VIPNETMCERALSRTIPEERMPTRSVPTTLPTHTAAQFAPPINFAALPHEGIEVVIMSKDGALTTVNGSVRWDVCDRPEYCSLPLVLPECP
jgi:hypothetical protein